MIDYFKRVTIIADEAKVPLVPRNGGGAVLEIQQADQSDKNHSWELSGIPPSWGPATVKKWAEQRQTAHSQSKGRFKNRGCKVISQVNLLYKNKNKPMRSASMQKSTFSH